MLTLVFRSLSLQKCTETISGRIGKVFFFMSLFLSFFFFPYSFFPEEGHAEEGELFQAVIRERGS